MEERHTDGRTDRQYRQVDYLLAVQVQVDKRKKDVHEESVTLYLVATHTLGIFQ